MKYLLLIVSIIAGLFIISFITEAIEFTTILSISNLSMNDLYRNPSLYQEIRNQLPVLIFKIIYTTIAGFVGGYITVFISHYFQRTSILFLMILQTISLIWAAFFSSLSSTLPLWTWIAIILLVPSGIYFGYYIRTHRLK